MKEVETREAVVQIVTPTRDDWEGVKNLRLEALQNDPQAFGTNYQSQAILTDEEWKEKLEKVMGDNPRELLVIAKDGNIYAGMIGAYPKNETVWNIKAVYVKSEYRGKGIGKMLVEEILRQIDEKEGVKATELMVNVKQDPAVRLYQRYGFEIVETLKDELLGDGNRYDEYVMRRNNKLVAT